MLLRRYHSAGQSDTPARTAPAASDTDGNASDGESDTATGKTRSPRTARKTTSKGG